MNSQCLYLLVIFTFLLPISLACDGRKGPMNGICTPCGPYCDQCYGDPNYCTDCYDNVLIRGKCRCDDIGCERCDDNDSSKCIKCKDGFYPKRSPEGNCIPCPKDCPYCGHYSNKGYEVCYKCEDPDEAYNRSTCTPCPKNCRECGLTDPSINEFKCSECEDGYTMTPLRESCAACLSDNCRSCDFRSLYSCEGCFGGSYLYWGECITNPPSCEYMLSPTQCGQCSPYFYMTSDEVCEPIPEEGCKEWDSSNLKCMDGCHYWDNTGGVCEQCYNFTLTTYANITSNIYKYEKCNSTCNKVTYPGSTNYHKKTFCLTENKCPPGYYLNKYRNCVSCGRDLCTNCTDEGCVAAYEDLIELFADDWKGKGKSFGVAIEEKDCDHGQYIYKNTYCFKDKCPSGMKADGTTCVEVSLAAYGVSFSLIFIFLILLI